MHAVLQYILPAGEVLCHHMLTLPVLVLWPVLHSPGPDRLQFACNVLLMLPEQVSKLSRRKAANAVECCCAAAALAQVGVAIPIGACQAV
jgi:hypothetical protein